jgi:hypothetical protein
VHWSKKATLRRRCLDINEVIQEVVSLTHSEIQKSGVVLKMNLAASLPVYRAIESNCNK